MIRELLSYREYIWANALWDVRHRFSGGALGAFWLVALPAAQIAVFALVFSRIMEARLPGLGASPIAFPLYLCSGLLPWIGLTDIITRSSSLLIGHSAAISRLALPEQVVFARCAAGGFLTILSAMLLFVAIAWLGGIAPTPASLAALPILTLWSAVGYGLGMAAGLANVLDRDVNQVVGLALQVGLWSVPIVYAESILSAGMLRWVHWNPLYPFIHSLHECLLFGRVPSAEHWLAMVAVATLSVAFGFLTLRALGSRVRDAL